MLGLPKLLNILSQLALRYSSLQSVVLCIAAMLLLVLQMSRFEAKIAEITSTAILDKQFAYTPEEALAYMRALGMEGRQAYLGFNVWDFGVPVTFSAMLAFMIGPVYVRARLWPQANLTPLLYAVCDLSENVAIRRLLNTFPEQSPTVVYLADAATRLKWLFTILVAGVLLIGLLAWARILSLNAKRPAPAHHD